MNKKITLVSLILASTALFVGCGHKLAPEGPGNTTNIIVPTNKPGDTDVSFGLEGRQSFFIGQDANIVSGTAQSDGKILMTGYINNAGSLHDFFLARLTKDGALDPTFGPSHAGTVVKDFGTSEDIPNAVAIQKLPASDRIIVAGSSGVNTAMAAFKSDGTPDTSFGANSTGLATSTFGSSNYVLQAIAFNSDRTIIGAGYATAGTTGSLTHVEGMMVARYSSQGTSQSVIVSPVADQSYFQDVAIDKDGKIVGAGRLLYTGGAFQMVVARYLNGTSLSVDSSFGASGYFRGGNFPGLNVSQANVVIPQSDGKYLIGGTVNTGLATDRLLLLRLNADGKSLDSSFGQNGKVVFDLGLGNTDKVNRISIQADKKIVVVGTTISSPTASKPFVARFKDDGSLDLTFAAGAGFYVPNFGPNDHGFIDILSSTNIIFGGWSTNSGSNFGILTSVFQ